MKSLKAFAEKIWEDRLMRLKLAIAVGAFSAALFAAGVAKAEGVELLPNGMLSPSSKELTPADKFKKAAPWRIGVSWPGVGNTWLVQTINEMKYEASLHKEISEFIFTDADWKTTKQVADIEDLLAKKVDALIIAPIAGPVVADQVAKAKAMGIPVVIFETGRVNTAGDTQISAGGEVFGQQGGEFIKKVLNGKGSIWAFRGIAGVDEEQARYDGFRKGIEGSDIKISAEEFGDWNYAKAKGLCENLALSGKPVDAIWFSGADMTRACIDVFKQLGKPLVPMTGEANNGFFRAWHNSGIESVAPIFTPGLGPSTVRAAVALLEGKQVYKSYFSEPAPILKDTLDKYYRADLNDAYWVPSTMPEAKIMDMYKK
jgi:ribose transport system substrate-binding protein